jgi:hypothetical protein
LLALQFGRQYEVEALIEACNRHLMNNDTLKQLLATRPQSLLTPPFDSIPTVQSYFISHAESLLNSPGIPFHFPIFLLWLGMMH